MDKNLNFGDNQNITLTKSKYNLQCKYNCSNRGPHKILCTCGFFFGVPAGYCVPAGQWQNHRSCGGFIVECVL